MSRECGFHGLVDVRVRKNVAERLRPARDDALALGDDHGHLAVERADREARHGREGGAMERAPERLGEHLVRDGLGGGRVDGPVPVLTVLGPLIWIAIPPKDETAEWHERKPWQRRQKPREAEMTGDAAETGGTTTAISK